MGKASRKNKHSAKMARKRCYPLKVPLQNGWIGLGAV